MSLNYHEVCLFIIGGTNKNSWQKKEKKLNKPFPFCLTNGLLNLIRFCEIIQTENLAVILSIDYHAKLQTKKEIKILLHFLILNSQSK